MLEQSTRDLTGQVVKADSRYFDFGGSSDIWMGRWARGAGDVTQTLLAVKVLRCAWTDIARFRKKFIREGMAWSTATHPNITPFLGISYDFDRPDMPCLVSPYYSHGNITSYLKDHPDIDKLPLITQVSEALSHLHNLPCSIIHGDIKGSNILINDKCEASLTDFGLSRILQTSGFTTKTGSGTWRFMAPELMNEEEPIPRVTAATDVWAFAMTVIEILTGDMPLSHIKGDAGVILAVTRGDRPKREHCPQINDDIWGMLEICWNLSPNRRPSMIKLSRFFALQSTSVSPRLAQL